MRIVILTAHRNLVGGVEKYLQVAIPGLLSRGHDVSVVYEHACDTSSERIDPLESSLRTWCLDETDVRTVVRSLAAWKPDVVYCHGLDKPESLAIEDALLESYPALLYVHNYDRTCSTGRKCHSFPQIEICTRRLGPMCLLLHYPRRCGGLHPVTMWRQFQRHTQLNSRLAEYKAILVASSHMHNEIQRHSVPPEKLHLLPLPTTDVAPQSVPPVANGRSGRILFVGRLTDLKGVSYLIEAIPIAAQSLGRTLTLTVAGDGPDRPKLQEAAARIAVPVEFAGWVETQVKLDLLRNAELLAVPSLWPEPFGLVGIEAGCLGLPAVGYASGGIPDWLIPGETGELAPTPPPTVEGLAAAIVRALASPEHYAKLRRGAWERAKQFSSELHFARLEAVLESAAAPTRENAALSTRN